MTLPRLWPVAEPWNSRQCRCFSHWIASIDMLWPEVTVALKNHLDAIQDSISDVQASLGALTDFLMRE
jgi:hypothetical protein